MLLNLTAAHAQIKNRGDISLTLKSAPETIDFSYGFDM